jgi:hypothetical protein
VRDEDLLPQRGDVVEGVVGLPHERAPARTTQGAAPCHPLHILKTAPVRAIFLAERRVFLHQAPSMHPRSRGRARSGAQGRMEA